MGATLRLLVFFAYGAAFYQVSGPDWIGSNLYNPSAKVSLGRLGFLPSADSNEFPGDKIQRDDDGVRRFPAGRGFLFANHEWKRSDQSKESAACSVGSTSRRQAGRTGDGRYRTETAISDWFIRLTRLRGAMRRIGWTSERTGLAAGFPWPAKCACSLHCRNRWTPTEHEEGNSRSADCRARRLDPGENRLTPQ
jgi:hypothetical protein